MNETTAALIGTAVLVTVVVLAIWGTVRLAMWASRKMQESPEGSGFRSFGTFCLVALIVLLGPIAWIVAGLIWLYLDQQRRADERAEGQHRAVYMPTAEELRAQHVHEMAAAIREGRNV